MILTAQPFVLVQFFGQVNLVTGTTEFRCLVHGFQKSTFVQGRFTLDQYPVDPSQKCGIGERKWIMLRRRNNVIRIAPRAAQTFYGMAGDAGDAGMSGGMILIIKIRFIECPAEQRHWIMAAGAES